MAIRKSSNWKYGDGNSFALCLAICEFQPDCLGVDFYHGDKECVGNGEDSECNYDMQIEKKQVTHARKKSACHGHVSTYSCTFEPWCII